MYECFGTMSLLMQNFKNLIRYVFLIIILRCLIHILSSLSKKSSNTIDINVKNE